jgi:cytochrome P450
MARKELSPAFSTNVIKTFIPIFEEETDKVVKSMSEKHLNRKEFNMVESMAELVINAGALTMFNFRDKISLAQQMAEPVDE